MSTSQQVMRAKYQSAESFLEWNVRKEVFNVYVTANWIGDGNRFWFRDESRSGWTFRVFDSGTREVRDAFDHLELTRHLTSHSGVPLEPHKLPIASLTFNQDADGIELRLDSGAVARIDASGYIHDYTGNAEAADIASLSSPDGRYRAYYHAFNLWVEQVETGERTNATSHGSAESRFGLPLMSPLIDAGMGENDYGQFPVKDLLPAALWSPDSTTILTHVIDTGHVADYHLVQHVPLDGSSRPKHYRFPYALPGEENVPKVRLVTFNVESGSLTELNCEPLDQLFFGSPLKRTTAPNQGEYVWWDESGHSVYILRRARGFRNLTLERVDLATNTTHTIVSEDCNDPIDVGLSSMGPRNVKVLGSGETIWYSLRDGWAHLYLYSPSGNEPSAKQLTRGPWMVDKVLYVDEEARVVYFTALGVDPDSDPYFARLYSCSLDTLDLNCLTPEEGDHHIQFPACGTYFVDNSSTAAAPGAYTVRFLADETSIPLCEPDIGALLQKGWTPPERHLVKARDGVTDIAMVVFRPTDFDPTQRYPVLDHIYAGPQVHQAPTSFAEVSQENRAGGYWQSQALAELGFIVVMIDGLGMPSRSRWYARHSYANLGDAGLPDHIRAIQHLDRTRGYTDLARVGIFGHSGGGYASLRALLTHPDFYHAAVSSAGNHEDLLYSAGWTERYQGYPVNEAYVEQANSTNAANLQGKLLLVHGDMDENVHPAHTIKVVDELIKANKEFDLLIMPNRHHFMMDDPYFIRRRWDYFVEHLTDGQPVRGYRITPDPNPPRLYTPDERFS